MAKSEIMSRLALDLCGIKYKETIIKMEEWPEKKSAYLAIGSFPFGQLPLLRIDNMDIVRTTSILRYLSRKYLFCKTDEFLDIFLPISQSHYT